MLEKWNRTLFLRDQGLEARGWLLDVMKCVEFIEGESFSSMMCTRSRGDWPSYIQETRTCGQRSVNNFNF